MKRYAVLLSVLAAVGCAVIPRPRQRDQWASPLAVQATLLREDPITRTVRPWRAEEVLRPDESVFVDVAVPETTYVSIVLYSARGESEDLAGSQMRLPAGAAKRFIVPRRAPPGIREQEMRLYVTASSAPLSGAGRGLLRLSCSGTADSGRGGDRDGNGGSSSGSGSGQGSGDSGRSQEREKKGPDDPKLCPAPAGQIPAITVIPIVVQSK